MKISLKPNTEDNSKNVPYFAEIEITTMTIDLEKSFQVPIQLRETNGKKSYVAEVCGFQVEADSPGAAVGLIKELITGLVNMSRLPTYVFIARRSHKMYPVYTHENEVFATTPGGPLFKHVELAKVREYLTDYLHNSGQLGTPGKSEKLHVRGVRRTNLALTRPIFYLKKRPQSSGDNEFWAPVFLTDDGGSIYTYAASGRREVDIAGGYEALLLRTQVAQALMADKRLQENYELRPDRLLPDYWERVKSTLTEQPAKLVFNGTSLETYRNGRFVVALEYRQDEDRYSLYLGKDIHDLYQHTAVDFVRRGLINTPDAMSLEGASASD